MDKLELILSERPMFHRGETEINRAFTANESKLSPKAIERLSGTELTCYGIGEDVLRYIAENVGAGSKTLETGAGCSTLIFAHCGASHIAVTPSHKEAELINAYALKNGISMDRVVFAQESSDVFLPATRETGFDVILLDGKHAFPWPIIDWFYTADKLKMGGLMIVDDIDMKSVSILLDFLKTDQAWEKVAEFSSKTIVFKKTRSLVHDVAWHMQGYNMISPIKKLAKRIRSFTMGG